MAAKKATRRRGKTLENAILEMAWNELLDHGYTNFTIEGVAKRAGTNRSVLSRRWQGRAELAVAAIGAYIERTPIFVPDLGNVRGELGMFLKKVSDLRVVVIAVLFSMRDYFAETNTSMAEFRSKFAHNQAVDEILQRAVGRGEIDSLKLTKRVVSLPMDLLRHEAFMTNKPIARAAINEILDTVFLPLVLAKKQSRS
jgi:AcrR family transcriptional regulator